MWIKITIGPCTEVLEALRAQSKVAQNQQCVGLKDLPLAVPWQERLAYITASRQSWHIGLAQRALSLQETLLCSSSLA